MEVKNSRSALLSNYEVYSLLKEVKCELKQKDKSQKSSGLSTVVYQTLKYLEGLPCRSQSSEAIAQFLTELKRREMKLTKAEKLQLLNNKPESTVELQLLIEESVDRFSEDNEKELIDLINTILPISNDTVEANTAMND